jgi:hypothetical protein
LIELGNQIIDAAVEEFPNPALSTPKRQSTNEIQEEQRRAYLHRLKTEKNPICRRKLWNELTKIENTSGGGLSKSVEKLYASWLKREDQMNATLEAGDDMILWQRIRINLEKPKDLVVHRLETIPIEHRIKLGKKCENYLHFIDAQRSELWRVTLFGEAQSPRSFMKLYRKALQVGILGWNPMVEALREAARRWSPSVVQKYGKTYFNQQEYQELWHGLSMFTPMDEELESRLIEKVEGIALPQGNDAKFVKWPKHEQNQRDHAHMMRMLQRTQQLDINEWREPREQAYRRFGNDRYKALLQERDMQTPQIRATARNVPMAEFVRKQAIFGALQEEKPEMTPEWRKSLREICNQIEKGIQPDEIRRVIQMEPGQRQKLKFVRKKLWEEPQEWREAREDMTRRGMTRGFRLTKGVIGPEDDEYWGLITAKMNRETEQAWTCLELAMAEPPKALM